MLSLSFANWNTKSGALFVHKRIYWNGGMWTPFARVFWRYCRDDVNPPIPYERVLDSLAIEAMQAIIAARGGIDVHSVALARDIGRCAYVLANAAMAERWNSFHPSVRNTKP